MLLHNHAQHVTVVFDGGDVPFSVTRVLTVGKAVVSVLQQPEATANRTIYVHDAIITQNQLIAIEEDLSDGQAFQRNLVDTNLLEIQAWQEYNNPASEPSFWIFSFINISIWSKEELCAFRSTDNDLLGISDLHGTELEEALREEIVKAKRSMIIANGLDGSYASSCKAAGEKALEDGKRRLTGFKRPRRSSQIERVIG